MSHSATRLTCFAMIAAIELDIRDKILIELGHLDMEDLISAEQIKKSTDRMAKEGTTRAKNLSSLLSFLDFAESYEILQSNMNQLSQNTAQGLSNIKPYFQYIVAIRNRVAHNRPMEIDDASTLIDAAKCLIRHNSSDWPEVQSILDRLENDPSFVLGLTISLPADPDNVPQHNLPVPDFDETGFFGRQGELRRIKKAIKGAYPVVSILGDGGIGKTSIALKAAYDLLDDPKQQFDAFVWVTAKATVLTPNEIQRINGAIETSLGLIGSAAKELSGVEYIPNPVDEVLEYMENFRVLLILDNLETVLDNRLRSFLLELPIGSKVIVTSRIGLGIENPVQLSPLEPYESARLLNALARIRDVKQLKGLRQDDIERLANSMQGHPAYIRWFVAGVQAGYRPEELLGNNELLLDYCMSNVYEYLSDNARATLRSMQVLQGPKNQAELAYLNDFTADEIQRSLLELITTNFTAMTSQTSGYSLDTAYELSDFSRQYLEKHHPAEASVRNLFFQRNEELRNLGIEVSAEITTSPLAPTSVYVRNAGDYHAAGLLRRAITDISNDTDAALALCTEAQKLAPGYFEGWRVEGLVRSLAQDLSGALAAYERAVELAPENAAVLFHFGDFLLNVAGEPHRALELLQGASRATSADSDISGQIAWAHFCLKDYDSTIVVSSELAKSDIAHISHQRAATTLALRAVAAAINEKIAIEDYDEAVAVLESGVDLLEHLDSRVFTDETVDRILQLHNLSEDLAEKGIGYPAKQSRIFSSRLSGVLQSDQEFSTRTLGSVVALFEDKGYGFFQCPTGKYFFHISQFLDRSDWEFLTEGDLCTFEPSQSNKGDRASGIRLLNRG